MQRAQYESFVSHLFHLSTQLGIAGASRALGIDYERAKKIAQRRKFNIQALRPKWLHDGRVKVPSSPDAIEATHNVMRHYGERSRMGLAIAGAKVGEHLADMDGTALIKPAAAISAQQWSQVGDRVHGWSAERTKAPQVQVAVVQLPSDAERAERASIDSKLDAIARRLRDTST